MCADCNTKFDTVEEYLAAVRKCQQDQIAFQRQCDMNWASLQANLWMRPR